MSGSNQTTDEGVGVIESFHPDIPSGHYVLAYLYYETAFIWGGDKVVARFAITDPDEYAGLEICRYYNVRAVKPRGRNGDYRVGDRSNLVREYRQVLGTRASTSEVRLDEYRNLRIRAYVRGVETDGNGKKLGLGSEYAVVGELLEIIDDL